MSNQITPSQTSENIIITKRLGPLGLSSHVKRFTKVKREKKVQKNVYCFFQVFKPDQQTQDLLHEQASEGHLKDFIATRLTTS